MEIMKNTDHILYSEDKNYLGHWDLPMNGDDLILTIDKIVEEDVKDPRTDKVTKNKRVAYFVEEGYKPMLLNATNRNRIYLSCGRIKDIKTYAGKKKKIALYIDQTYSSMERCKVDCIRIRSVAPVIVLPPLEDSNIPSTVKWMQSKKANTMAALKQMKTVTKEQETQINNLLNSKK